MPFQLHLATPYRAHKMLGKDERARGFLDAVVQATEQGAARGKRGRFAQPLGLQSAVLRYARHGGEGSQQVVQVVQGLQGGLGADKAMAALDVTMSGELLRKRKGKAAWKDTAAWRHRALPTSRAAVAAAPCVLRARTTPARPQRARQWQRAATAVQRGLGARARAGRAAHTAHLPRAGGRAPASCLFWQAALRRAARRRRDRALRLRRRAYRAARRAHHRPRQVARRGGRDGAAPC